MIPTVLSHYRFPLLSCFGLVIFLAVFMGVIAWIFRRGSAEFYQGVSQAPLEKEPHHE